MRYTKEELTLNGRYQNAAGQLLTVGGRASPYFDQLSFNPWTWRFALDHQFKPDLLGYVSYNHGFKSGGYNLATPDRDSFLPEKLDAYEVGMKSELMNHRLRLNAAVFYYDYKDIQVVIVPGGAGQIFTNAAAARNYGLDASLEFAATDHLTLSAGVGVLDAKYADYPNAQGNSANGGVINIANAKGRSLAYAPPVTGFVSANYRVPTAAGEFRGSVTASYSDEYFINPAEVPVLGPFLMTSAAVEWRSNADRSWGLRLWGRNLGDEYVGAGTTASSGGWYSTYGAPRTYGVTLLKDF